MVKRILRRLWIILVVFGIALGGLVPLSVFQMLVPKRTMQVQPPQGYLVLSGGILEMPSGEWVFRVPRRMTPYIMAYTNNGDNWYIYDFGKSLVKVYNFNRLMQSVDEIRDIDISKVYKNTEQFYYTKIDVTGSVLAVPSPDRQSYYFINLLDGSEPRVRNFQRVFYSGLPFHFWVYADGCVLGYNFRDDSTERINCGAEIGHDHVCDISPNGKYILSAELGTRGIVGIKSTVYSLRVHDLVSGHSRFFRVSGVGTLEKVMFLDNRYALLVFGLPLTGQWEIKVVDVSLGDYLDWKRFRSRIWVHSYFPNHLLTEQGSF